MYNRYIPQSDGSYHRNRVPDRPPPASKPSQPPQQPCETPPKGPPPDSGQPVMGFLRNLLPKEFDTGDLLVVLLLLLMAGDSEDQKSNALLTLALYFFL